MVDFTVVKCDIKTAHPKGYFHNAEDNPAWLLMCFHTPFVYFKDGKYVFANAGDCLINPPGKYVSHGSVNNQKTGFQNDWIFFSCKDANTLLNKLAIPINEHFSLGNPYFLTEYIQNIICEKLDKREFYEEKISCIMNNMFLDISRVLKYRDRETNVQYSQIQHFRNDMLTCVDKEWSLEKMASASGYSVSRFCYLYKSCFGISPCRDLVQMRVEKAKKLLVYSGLSIGIIAQYCGFSSDHHFSYTFKKETGVTPMQYRKQSS